MHNCKLTIICGALTASLLVFFAAPASAAADLRKDCQSHQIAACGQILESNPKDLAALANRGIGFRLMGEYDHAVADFDLVLRLNPNMAGLHLERGLALEAKGDAQGAIIDFTQELARDPTLVQAYFGRAMAYAATGQNQLSVVDLDAAKRLDRTLVAALYMDRGYALIATRHYGEAISAFDATIEINPNWVSAYFGRASSFDAKGDSQRAAEDYRKCIELDPKSDLDRQRQKNARERLGDN